MPSPLRAVLALVPLALAPAAGGERDWSKVEVEVEQVAPGVAMLRGAGGNIGLAYGAGGAFLVDDQYAPLHEKLLRAVRSVTAQPIRFVLNTHWHGDHTGGNEALGKAGTLVIAHDNVRKRMSSEQFVAFWEDTVAPSPPAALPVVTFSDAVTFHLDGEEIHTRHLPPAHTDGDSVVTLRRANVVHLGDVFFNRLYPFIDASSGGSLDGTVEAVEAVLGEIDEATKVIPGHGPLGDRAALAAYRDMLVGVREAVRAQVRSGRSQAEVVAAKPTAPWDEVWGGGWMTPDRFAELVYQLVKADLARPAG
jgi:glyoxylase-like metal-dependent hydrolase (beta-lactamase superfamily II)